MHPSDEPYRIREIWPPGTVIKGDYSIQRKLGGGGFGTVYLAQHRFLNTIHVIKRLHEHYASDPDYVRKFVTEARAVRRLRGCPNVVDVDHMTQSEDGHLILVMEHIPGGDLAGLMDTRQLSIDEVIDYTRQIATGLAAAHAAGLIHRDIKPHNVMVSHDSTGKMVLKLIDFGIVADHLSQQQTSVMRGGSIGYAAPEQWIKAGKALDGRTDLYSLGASMYRMLCGRLPYEADDVYNWIDQAKKGPPPAPILVRKDVPQALSDLILELLALRPEDRPADAATVIRRLDAIRLGPVEPYPPTIEEVPAKAAVQDVQDSRAQKPPPDLPQTPRETPPKYAPPPSPPRSKWRIWTTAGVLAALLSVGVWFVFEYESAQQPAGAPVGPAEGTRVNPKDRLRYAYIPPGTFRMGCSPGDDACSPDEKPAHDVRVLKGFWMGQTDVTVAAYTKYVSDSRGSMPEPPDTNLNWSDGSVPMTMVSWNDAHDYCAWAGMRLPTEAEWEYAARAGSTGPRYGELDEIAWWGGNSGDKRIDADDILKNDGANYGKRIVENGDRPHGVALKRANSFKLYDMLGNVWQWTADWYKAPYESSGVETDLRGGSWGGVSSSVRASVRSRIQPAARYSSYGFRCAGEIRVP